MSEIKLRISLQIPLILQGTFLPEGASALTQSLELLSTIIAVVSRLLAKLKAHLMASASAWRGRLEYTLLAQANTTSPLQSLATTTMEELPSLKAASTFILIKSLGGFFYLCTGFGNWKPEWIAMDIVCSTMVLSTFWQSSIGLVSLPSKMAWFLALQMASQIIALNNKNSPPLDSLNISFNERVEEDTNEMRRRV